MNHIQTGLATGGTICFRIAGALILLAMFCWLTALSVGAAGLLTLLCAKLVLAGFVCRISAYVIGGPS